MASSIYAIPVTAVGPVGAGVNILTSGIEITSEMVTRGGGGVLRLMFSFGFGTSPSEIEIFNNSVLKGTLNADHANEIISNGYYRFDLDVEAGDSINLQSSVEPITGVNFIRAHFILFGT